MHRPLATIGVGWAEGERFLRNLSVLAIVAPLTGLLGTVTGLIFTFLVLTDQSGPSPSFDGLIIVALGVTVAALAGVAVGVWGAYLRSHVNDLKKSEPDTYEANRKSLQL